MTDDTEDEDGAGGELECTFEPPDFRGEYIEWSAPNGDGGTIIFPRGTEQFADDNDVQVIRVSSKTGAIEVLQELGASWHAVDKPLRQAALKSIK